MKCQFLHLVPWVLIIVWLNDTAEVKQMCVIHVWMFCVTKCGPETLYRIMGLSCWLWLFCCRRWISTVLKVSLILKTWAYESAMATRPREKVSVSQRALRVATSHNTGRFTWVLTLGLQTCETSLLKTGVKSTHRIFIMFYNCAASVGAVRPLRVMTSARISHYVD